MSILHLPQWEVAHTEHDAHNYTVSAKYTQDAHACPSCKAVDRLIRFGTLEQTFLDLPVHTKRVVIHVERQRYRCAKCGKTFMQPLPDMHDQRLMTRRLCSYIQQESLKTTFTSIAESVGVDESLVRLIFREYVATLNAAYKTVTPDWLGIDEIHILGKPRCVITNVREHTIVDMLDNRNKTTVAKWFSNVHDRHKIKLAAMDMWNPYRDVVSELMPKAKIIVDKYHVVRMANQSLEVVRKGLRESLTDAQRRQLKDDRFILLTRRSKLSPDKLIFLDVWTKAFPTLGTAYKLKESFYEIWDTAKSSREARKQYNEWQKTITPDLTEAFQPLTTAVENWSDEIFAYFDTETHITNAFTESLNGTIRLTDRLGRGYSFAAIRAKILYHGGLRKVVRPSVRSRKSQPTQVMGQMVIRDEQHSYEAESLDYGVDISTLARLLQEGKF